MQATHAGATQPQYQEARDRTLYWTLSFYLPARLVGTQRPYDATDEATDEATRQLREAIEPLFNDIADRSSWEGKVEDRMFAAAPATRLALRMPAQVRWSTEGRRYVVAVPDDARRDRQLGLRRFWYQHGNGAISWHLGFDYYYGDDLAAEVAAGGQPALTYYFMSLLQKLAWPKEFRTGNAHPTTDGLVGIDVRPEEGADWQGFWAFAEQLFREDCGRLLDQVSARAQTGDPATGQSTSAALEDFITRVLTDNLRDSIEIPGLRHHECRSLFFLQDAGMFDLIQPVDPESRQLVKRRTRVLDDDYKPYPQHLRDSSLVSRPADNDDGSVLLGDAYWRAMRAAGDRDAETRLAYLFLAGFNQNIIDFMNQEASEVLDSLDPIYPNSDEQEEEGFFIRYANPRSMITYVKRSRTLEVGNDWIGTCPYAFLIHVLAMHNEALTRAQERDTFDTIDKIKARIDAKEFEKAEEMINAVRIDAFEVYERHRYHNPFRYDTERDVFESLEQLRGTSRRKQAYELGLASLEEQTRDLERKRQNEERRNQERAKEEKLRLEKIEDAKQRKRDGALAILFGLLGVSGVIQVLYQWHLFTYGEPQRPLNAHDRLLSVYIYIGAPLLAGLVVISLLLFLNRRK